MARASTSPLEVQRLALEKGVAAKAPVREEVAARYADEWPE
jgi:hypothetical protein